MKNALALLALIVATPAMAIPDVVTWAARVENDAGAFNGNMTVTFELFDVLSAGTPLWTETVSSAVVVDGDLVHDLGSVEVLDDALIDRDNLFLQVTMNGDVLAPRSALRAVPYALRAENAATAELAERATDATKLGGLAPTAFQFRAAASGGLALAGTEFSIAPLAVTSARLADGAVTSTKLAPLSVTGAAIASNTIVAGKLAVDSVSSSNLAGNTFSVRTQPAGCGGDLQVRTFGVPPGVLFPAPETTSCKTDVCGHRSSTNEPMFYVCDGRCIVTVSSPVTCDSDDYGPVVGSLVFAP